MGYGCYFSCQKAEIIIGKNCGIAAGVKFITDSHVVGTEEKRCGANFSKSIEVEDGCWIGAGATILPGVVIHKGCVIAAGSVVTKSCDENCLYSGCPATKKKCYENIGDSPGIQL